jgi:hypothetical protein
MVKLEEIFLWYDFDVDPFFKIPIFNSESWPFASTDWGEGGWE